MRCHLLTFHRLTSAELRSAEYLESHYNGSLVIRPHRQLAAWTQDRMARDDMHRVGHWERVLLG